MFRLILLSSLLITALFSSDISEQHSFDNLLPNAFIYIDQTNTLNLNEVSKQVFSRNYQKQLGFGYSPNFTVWVKFTLKNPSSKPIHKVIEYANPLTTSITLFDAQTNQSTQKGLLYTHLNPESLNPIFQITLAPNSSKTLYLRAETHITTLIVDLRLWNRDHFYQYEQQKQFILAMFFGAMSLIILYNLFIYIGTREMSYLYYVLFFLGITLHHAIYKGVVSLYLLSPEQMEKLIEFSSFIVAFPTLFLALFTKNILDLKQYPMVNRVLNLYLFIFPLLVLFIYWNQLYAYRNIFSVGLLVLLFGITCYAVFKRNRQAYFIISGWLLFVTSGLFMYLSSLGVYNIFDTFPYYTEASLVAESLIFSLSLLDKIKQLKNSLISYQKEEEERLSQLVHIKTKALEKSIKEKELLLRELNHRVKNSIQTIVAFLRLQQDEIKDKGTQEIVQGLENRVMAINHLYALLHTKENLSSVDSYTYFSLLIDDIAMGYHQPHIDVSLKTTIKLPSKYALYCGFILNEAISNAYKHAFKGKQVGKVLITLSQEENEYQLIIQDDGIGYNHKNIHDTLGLTIIETLVSSQLSGQLKIDAHNGVTITILWSDNG